MEKNKVTRSIHRLPFAELDPRRFEDMTLGLLYGSHKWADIQHIGRTGDDGGTDIVGKEILENGEIRSWAVQCKRLAKASAADLRKAAKETLSRAGEVPKVLLLVVGCDLSKSARDEFFEHSTSLGVAMPLIWAASELEAKLFAERPDLLFTYFGISTLGRARSKEATLKRNLALKKRMQKDFRLNREEWKAQKGPSHNRRRFRYCKTIIHSIDDESYPEVDTERTGISGWFGVEFYDFYHNGVEVGLRAVSAVVNSDGTWALIDSMDQYNDPQYQKVTILMNARIPFRNIVEYDLDGDEYYNSPHVYVQFANGGMPYEQVVYRKIGEHGYDEELDLEKQYKLAPPATSSHAA